MKRKPPHKCPGCKSLTRSAGRGLCIHCRESQAEAVPDEFAELYLAMATGDYDTVDRIAWDEEGGE